MYHEKKKRFSSPSGGGRGGGRVGMREDFFCAPLGGLEEIANNTQFATLLPAPGAENSRPGGQGLYKCVVLCGCVPL